jgi:hypothetical protein
MVRINDEEGSQFEAPVDVVWKYLGTPEAHSAAHRNSRNRAMKPLGEGSFLVSWEQNVNGSWVKVANRVTMFPPLGMAAEQVEGPLAGSKMFTVYTPRGAKTEISIYGNMESPTIPAAQLEPAVRAAWENAFNEDSTGIREFARKSR